MNNMNWNETRLSQDAFKVIRAAQAEAQRIGHKFVGPEFLLLGLFTIESETCSPILNGLGITINQIRTEVENAIDIRFNRSRANHRIPLTKNANILISKAVLEAQKDKQEFTSSIYLLRSLVQNSDSLAVRVLESTGINVEQLRHEITQKLETKKISFQTSNQDTALQITQSEPSSHLKPNIQTSKVYHEHQENSRLNTNDQLNILEDTAYAQPQQAEKILSILKINKAELKSIKSRYKRCCYRAIIQFLTDYTPQDESNLEKAKSYIESFYYLWSNLKEYEKAISLLEIPLSSLNNLKLCKQLNEWGNHEEEMKIYELMKSPTNSQDFQLSDWQSLELSLLLANTYQKVGRFRQAEQTFGYSSMIFSISPENDFITS